MIVLKILAILLAALATLGGVLGGSYLLVQDNPFDTSHQHELVLVEAKDATCTEEGVKKHYDCKGCDDVFADAKGYVKLEKADVTVEATGHYWKDATCTEKKTCEFCETTEGEPLGHTPAAAVRENITPASCIAEGACESVVYCSDCNTELSRTDEVLKKTSHIPAAAVKENEIPATCYSEGSYDSVVNCSECGALISRINQKVEKLSHTPADAVVENEKAATCEAAGSYDNVVYCSVEACKAKISTTTVEIKALGHTDSNGDAICDRSGCGESLCSSGHTEVVDPSVAPTCTTTGLTEGKHCSVCNTVTVPQEVVPIAHKLAFSVRGTLAINKDGSYDTTNLVVSMSCTECGEYEEVIPQYAAATDETDEVAGYVINAATPLENGGSITYGEHTFTFPALNLTNYDAASTYNVGTYNDKNPTVTTVFTLKDSAFACSVISGDAINTIEDGSAVVYSRYEVSKLCNEYVTVTYDEATGYLYASKKLHTIPYIATYGANLTITGNVNIKTLYRVNVNNALTIGTDDVAGYVRIERTKAVNSNNHVIGLYGGGDLTIKNGSLTAVGYVAEGNSHAVFAGAADSVFTVEKNGKFIAEGALEYSICSKAGLRVIVDGEMDLKASIYLENTVTLGEEYEYGFLPNLYIRSGKVTVNGGVSRMSSLQVGSEKENASGTLSLTSSGDVFYMGASNVRMTFAKGTVSFESTGTNKAIYNTGGGVTATDVIIDYKSGIKVTAKAVGSSTHFMGIWQSKATGYKQSWMIEEGAELVFTNITNLATVDTVSPVKVIAYKEVQMNIDGEVKTVLVASTLAGSTKTPADLVFPTVDTTATWTTDESVAAVNGFSAATDGTNTIYYKVK